MISLILTYTFLTKNGQIFRSHNIDINNTNEISDYKEVFSNYDRCNCTEVGNNSSFIYC